MPMFFPDSADIPVPTREDLAACRGMLRCGSRSFFAASLLLPRHVHEPATALYAFCRQADDAIDCGDDQGVALSRLSERLDRAYAGNPVAHPADRAFAAIVASTAMPRKLPEALLEGFAWDAEGRRYETPAALYEYAARVAGSVGAMMAVLMGVRTEAALARACDLGMAMQLTNIARDVGEDARAGRLYLPLSWLRDAGIDPEAFLAAPAFSTALGGVIRRLVGCSDRLYARGMPGVADLPLACRPGIRAAGLLYAGIGQQLARLGYDSVTTRARVPAARKAGLLARSLAAALVRQAAPTKPLPAALGLVAASALPPPQPPVRKPIGEQMVWLLDLFERLEDSSLRERGAIGN